MRLHVCALLTFPCLLSVAIGCSSDRRDRRVARLGDGAGAAGTQVLQRQPLGDQVPAVDEQVGQVAGRGGSGVGQGIPRLSGSDAVHMV